MRGPVGQALAWSRTHQGRKLIRFTSVSAVSTATSITVITIVYALFHWGVVEATIFGNVVATLPSYYLNRTWTWGKTGRSHLMKEIVPFWSMSSLGITCSFLGSLYAKHVVKSHHLAHSITGTLVVDGVNFGSFAIFWVLKLIVFNRIFHVPSELVEIEEHLVVEEHHDDLVHDGAATDHAQEVSPGS